ncbi:MAG: family 10 glycosylhydrolase [Cyanobacteria bacterium SZAS-4]|nr:family 10 glycosylhydrolase [Cyanobacteria bacterium SZAS-4]
MTFGKPSHGRAQKIISATIMALTTFTSNLFLNCAPAFAAAPVAVLKSSRNAIAYQEAHLGTYDEDWNIFKRTLDAANVRFDELSDIDVSGGPSKLQGYKLIVVPLLVDEPPDVVAALTEFQKGGGKLLITDAAGAPLPNGQALESLAGVVVSKTSTSTDAHKLQWSKSGVNAEEFPVGSVSADFTLQEGATPLATWSDAAGNKLGSGAARKNNALYLSWAPGLQGDITANSRLLQAALEELSPGITQQSAVQISFAEFQTIQQELDYLTKRTEETINTAKQADLAVPFKVIQQDLDAATDHVKKFKDAYHDRRYYEADEYLQKARADFSLAFAQAMPVRPVEARSVWLDRGTIVATKGPKGMTAVFDKLKAAGINVVYFETNNAGFVMYPSKLGVQNPDTVGWDPLGAALKEARRHNMELHAWMWVFNVGNTKHNPIVGKPADYPGPVLSTHDFTWALASATGSLIPPKQSEFWIDPSSPDGKRYIKDLIMEVAKNYDVDGIQLDYIRYPFNGKGGEMGYNWLGRQRFEQDTGLNLDHLDEETRQVWQAWKIAQVNGFVKDVSTTLRAARPKMRISCAVYAMPKRMRLNLIQQEWETWVANGWIDTLNPMTYVPTAKELTTAAGYVRESTADRVLVYPGLSIRQLDTAGLVEQLDSAREMGTLGTTMFAAAHLDDKKSNVLKIGPYRRQPLLTPQSEPLRASRLLVDDFAAMVNRYLQDPQKHIMSDQASTNDVLQQIDAIQKAMHGLNSKSSPDAIEAVLKDVTTLHNTIKNWLRLEAFIQRGFRAQYIVSYLGQVEAILSYASHKAKSVNNSLAETTGSELRGTPLRKPRSTAETSAIVPATAPQ